MAVFLRKLLGIGKLPDELRAEVQAEGIIHLAEYVPVTRRFTGRVPGMRSAGSISSYVGSMVLTNQRVLATLSSVPKLAGRTIDRAPSRPSSPRPVSCSTSTSPRSTPAARGISRCTTRTPSPRMS